MHVLPQTQVTINNVPFRAITFGNRGAMSEVSPAIDGWESRHKKNAVAAATVEIPPAIFSPRIQSSLPRLSPPVALSPVVNNRAKVGCRSATANAMALTCHWSGHHIFKFLRL
jgi:hypothetical protein